MAGRGASRRSASDWAREVAAWRRSGKSAVAYASGRGIKASTLTWWAWRLRRDEDARQPRGRQLLVPVDVVRDDVDEAGDQGDGGWELVTPDGHRVRGDGTLSPELVAALVAALVRRR